MPKLKSVGLFSAVLGLNLIGSAQAALPSNSFSDLMWRHQDGRNHLYFFNGNTLVDHHRLPQVAPEWRVEIRADFNGDGQKDILWRHSDGTCWIYMMDGAAVVQSARLGQVGMEWQVVGSGDINGDATDDIIWRHQSSGLLWGYQMQGAMLEVSQAISGPIDGQWQVLAVADISGDGQADILWRNTNNGQLWVYQLQSHQISQSYPLNRVGADWVLAGAGDFNGDGSSDLLWRNSNSGQNWLYTMVDGHIDHSGSLNWIADQQWSVAAISDLNGDQVDDILWYHQQRGELAGYLMHDGQIAAIGTIATVADTLWQIAGEQIRPPNSDDKLPLISMDAFEYLGGFRVSAQKFGDLENGKMDFSHGIFTYNPQNHSIIAIGHPHSSHIAELPVPNLINSANVSDFEQVTTALQDFAAFYETDRVDTGIGGYFRPTGLGLVDGKLIVNYINWYDASGTETDTTVVFDDPSDLAGSSIQGPFQVAGAAHAAGWISPIPQYWQQSLGGSHIFGNQSGASIISRLSVGPAAFVISPSEQLLQNTTGAIDTVALLDFPLSDMLYDKSLYDENTPTDEILYNNDGNNDLWTVVSGAGYGFIVPNTRTYVTVGKSGGHESGLGYKITQTDGHLCGGPCPYDPNDVYHYYWLWDLDDLLKVKAGEMERFEVRPYDYGELVLPVDVGNATLRGGAFDPDSGRLYLSIPGGDTIGQYARPPVFVVLQLLAERIPK